MSNTYDTIIVGGGFAGVTAARELKNAGATVLLLEAHDHVGGRTWSTEFAGKSVDLGGTWIHWMACPHAWAETTRYGLKLIPEPMPDEAFYVVDGKVKRMPADEFFPILHDLWDQFCAQSRELIPRPYDIMFTGELIREADKLTVQDRLDQLDLSEEEFAILRPALHWACGNKASEISLVQLLHWHARAGWSAKLMFEANGAYRFEGGTRELLDAILEDGTPTVHLSTPVTAIDHDRNGVTVSVLGGEKYKAATAVLAMPLNAWRTLKFAPALSEAKRTASVEAMAGFGGKFFVQIRTSQPAFYAQASEGNSVGFVGTHFNTSDGQVLVGFTSDRTFDSSDKSVVAEAVQRMIPGVEVVDSIGHPYYKDDEYFLGGWTSYRPRQTTRFHAALSEPEGRLFFAGADIANGLGIDGAIETGLRVGREIKAVLKHEGVHQQIGGRQS
jgi:monoamine oxidase